MKNGRASIFLFVVALHGGPWARAEDGGRDLSGYFGEYSGAFVLYDAVGGTWLRHRPDLCKERVTPCSTFKIPNSLIALETGVADGPEFRLEWDGVRRGLDAWNRDQTLRGAYAASCVWYYQELARRVGKEKMDALLAEFRYGNGDTSSGLTEFWLSGSLKISPDEQVNFLRRLQEGKLPVSAKALDAVLDVMVVSREGGTVYRGKTGTAGDAGAGAATRGWWVGSVATPEGNFYFATCITGGEARRITEAILGDLKVFPVPEG